MGLLGIAREIISGVAEKTALPPLPPPTTIAAQYLRVFMAPNYFVDELTDVGDESETYTPNQQRLLNQSEDLHMVCVNPVNKAGDIVPFKTDDDYFLQMWLPRLSTDPEQGIVIQSQALLDKDNNRVTIAPVAVFRGRTAPAAFGIEYYMDCCGKGAHNLVLIEPEDNGSLSLITIPSTEGAYREIDIPGRVKIVIADLFDAPGIFKTPLGRGLMMEIYYDIKGIDHACTQKLGSALLQSAQPT
jgi:hypothetical protein